MHAYKSIALLSVLSIGLTFNPSVTKAHSMSNTTLNPSLEELNNDSGQNPTVPTCPGTPGCDRRNFTLTQTESKTVNLALKTETQERASGRDKLPVSPTQARASGRRESDDNLTKNTDKCERASGRYRQNLTVDNCPFNRVYKPSPL